MLTDAQIDRYSRQIIVSEIGGRGQERLLAASVAVIGSGAMARVLTPYLVGAGIGRLYLCPTAGEDLGEAHRLTADLADVNPDTRITVSAATASEWATACDVAVATISDGQALRQVVAAAASAGCPLIAAGGAGSSAWLAVGGEAAPDACVGCAAVAARAVAAGSAFASAAATGAIAALLALEVLRRPLQLAGLAPGRWLLYDGETAVLTEGHIVRQNTCEVCAERA